MKIMKKIAAAALASAALFAFVGCAGGDDPNEMISGSGKNYSIDYTNDTNDTSRGYKETVYKHSGAAVQLDFLNVSADTVKAGMLGFIFDLEEKDGKRSFDIIGVRTLDANGKLGYYISRFENITDIQAANFGASATAADGEPKEIVYKTVDTSAEGTKAGSTVTVYAFSRLVKMDEAGKDSKNISYAAGDCVYEVYLLTNEIDKLNGEGNPLDKDGNVIALDPAKRLATIATSYKNPSTDGQNKLAVYANVYSGKTLAGKWTYRGDYKEVGVDEN